jgi:site-specific recombinase XerD
VLVRAGKGGKRRIVGMDDWGWQHVSRWIEHRIQLPIGPLLCILAGPTRGHGWSATAARGELRRLAAQAGVRRRFAPHQLRHAHAKSDTSNHDAGRRPGRPCVDRSSQARVLPLQA